MTEPVIVQRADFSLSQARCAGQSAGAGHLMTLVPIASPQSESELSVMLCTLEACGVPTFVQGRGFGSLYPGPQIAAYNARRIMVPAGYEAQAEEALKVFAQPLKPSVPDSVTVLNKLRVVLEVILFGWFVPGNRHHAAAAPDSSSSQTLKKPRVV